MVLNFSFSEASDNKSITIQDTTADWVAGDIAEIYAHRADGITLATLDLTIAGIAYDTINVISFFAAGNQAGLAFKINNTDLKLLTVSPFTSASDIPDGDIEILYTVVDDHNALSDTFTDSYLIYGAIEKKVLLEMLETNVQSLTSDSSLYRANVRLLHFSYFMSILNSAYSGQIDNLRTSLANLNAMIDNDTF